MNQFIEEDGIIRTYELKDFNIDNIPSGRLLLTLYQQTLPDKYKKASDLLCSQLVQQLRQMKVASGIKKIIPHKFG